MSQARSRFFDRTLPDHGWSRSDSSWRQRSGVATLPDSCRQVEVGSAVERENFSYFQLSESAQRAGDRGRFIAFGIRL